VKEKPAKTRLLCSSGWPLSEILCPLVIRVLSRCSSDFVCFWVVVEEASNLDGAELNLSLEK
jgi:hypothetical protein